MSCGIAVAADAGIPLTHRGINTSFTVVSGHLGAQGEFWDYLPDYSTLVILMGVRKLPLIVSHLLRNGKPADLPVAVIESGATAQQRVTVGTLDDIVEKAGEVGVKSPALVVVGDVVGLREQFDWFDVERFGDGEKVWGEAVA